MYVSETLTPTCRLQTSRVVRVLSGVNLKDIHMYLTLSTSDVRRVKIFALGAVTILEMLSAFLFHRATIIAKK